METLKQLLSSLPTMGMLAYKDSLENYLIALWMGFQILQQEQLSPARVYQILGDATQIEPIPFDGTWMKYSVPPFSFQPNEQNEFEYFKQTILFQIADLRRMKEAGILNLSPITLYGGVKSPTDHSWYNFTVADYFECAVAGFGSHCERYEIENEWTNKFEKIGRPVYSTEFSWKDLADLLEFGRIYE